MIIEIASARDLCESTLRAFGYIRTEASAIADHLLDCELRGHGYGGLARALSIGERLSESGFPTAPIHIVKETSVSASIDGADHVGYLVGKQVVETAIAKAHASGMAAVGAFNTWYTGMLSYYLEALTEAGLVGLCAANAPPMVAPHGSSVAKLGTNPFGIGFPTAADPVILDFGTSAVMHSDVMLRKRLRRDLPAGTAFDAAGIETSSPEAALAGAFAVWGGHRGSGLSLMVHLLGMMCGGAAAPNGLRDSGLFLLAVTPGLLDPAGDAQARVEAFVQDVRRSRPTNPREPVKVPYDRSLERRRAALRRGHIELPDEIYRKMTKIAS